MRGYTGYSDSLSLTDVVIPTCSFLKVQQKLLSILLSVSEDFDPLLGNSDC